MLLENKQFQFILQPNENVVRSAFMLNDIFLSSNFYKLFLHKWDNSEKLISIFHAFLNIG